MHIFVSIDGGKPIRVEVKPSDTIREAIEEASGALRSLSDEQLEVQYVNRSHRSRPAKLSVPLSDYDIQEHEQLKVATKEAAQTVPKDTNLFDPEVEQKLQQFLRTCAAELVGAEITFIGVGSRDFGHGSASIRRQQCPDSLLQYCIRNGVDLNIILVDSAFIPQQSPACEQVYDFPGWQQHAEDNKGKIRHYKYAPAVAASACDVWLTVFATRIREYTDALANQGKVIAGVHLPTTFAKAGADGSALICGNFYMTDKLYSTDKTQYFTLGSAKVIEAAGFVVNA